MPPSLARAALPSGVLQRDRIVDGQAPDCADSVGFHRDPAVEAVASIAREMEACWAVECRD